MPRLFNLKHPAVMRAREKYDIWHGNRKNKLSFDEMFDDFSKPCRSFTYIASKADVSKESIRQTYKKWFARFFPSHLKTGMNRQSICSIVHQKNRLKHNKDVFKKKQPFWHIGKVNQIARASR